MPYPHFGARVAPTTSTIVTTTRGRPYNCGGLGDGRELDETDSDWRTRVLALPLALTLAAVVMRSDAAHALLRMFVSMWIHELGHATAAWLCGFSAFPGPWFTPVSDERSTFLMVAFSVGEAALAYLGFRSKRYLLVGLGALLLCLQLYASLRLSRDSAQALILFMGDGGCFLLGSALMATLYAREESPLVQRQLRWGLLIFGAIAFMDAADTWWDAQNNVDKIPFGELEGIESDPTRLTGDHGWAVSAMIRRYQQLGWACLASLGLLYLWGLWRAYRARDRALA